MENSLRELWSVFDFVLPGYLFTYPRFASRYEIPITEDNDGMAAKDLSAHIRPFILRRLKKDVLNELPEKIEHTMVTDLTAEQKVVYVHYLSKIKEEIETGINEIGFEKSRMKIMKGLTRLCQICCHPSLFVEGFDGDSGKLLLLQEIKEECMEGGHRILLFSFPSKAARRR